MSDSERCKVDFLVVFAKLDIIKWSVRHKAGERHVSVPSPPTLCPFIYAVPKQPTDTFTITTFRSPIKPHSSAVTLESNQLIDASLA